MTGVKENLKIFRRLFINRADVYGTRAAADGRIWQAKEPLTDTILLDHLMGRKPVGIYSMARDGTTKWACIDMDYDNFSAACETKIRCKHYNLPVYVERSKSKGYHIWGFFRSPVPAYKIRAVFKRILAEAGMEATELFPKQSYLREGGYGNFVWLPLFGYLSDNGLASRGRTVFVSDYNAPYMDQFRFLGNVELISQQKLDRLIGVNNLEPGKMAVHDEGAAEQHGSEAGMSDKGDEEDSFFWAPSCLRRILSQGVPEGLRNESCFHLAILLYRAGIPKDLGRVTLERWNLRNQPPLMTKEMETAVQRGYSGQYSSYGCHNLKAYCSTDCPIYGYRKKKGWL